MVGKTALITDMASPMGWAVAGALVRAGAHVHGVNPDHDECIRQVRHLRRSGNASGYVVDLREGTRALHFADLIREQVKRVHLVVSNARVALKPELGRATAPAGAAGAPILGELALIQGLLDVLDDEDSAADPACVILVGSFGLTVPPRLKDVVASFADRLADRRVNFNVINLVSLPGEEEHSGCPVLIDAIVACLRPDGAGRTGGMVEVSL